MRGCWFKLASSVVIIIISEKTSHIDSLFLLFLFWLRLNLGSSGTTGGGSSSWGSGSHGCHFGETSRCNFIEFLSTHLVDESFNLIFISFAASVLEELGDISSGWAFFSSKNKEGI